MMSAIALSAITVAAIAITIPVITGIVMAIAAAVIALNAVADIIAVRLDPRLEMGRGATGLG